MGNADGIIESIMRFGTNATIRPNRSMYFSFANGDEIALVYKDGFYILNCDEKLWAEVRERVKKDKTVKGLKSWWIKKSKNYEISVWSGDFEDLK